MVDECSNKVGGEQGRDAWREVGEQFEELGRTLARAVKASWGSEEAQRRLRGMQTGLQAMVEDIGEAIREAVPRPQADELKQQAERAMEATRAASHQAVEDVRPHLLAALRAVNGEVQTLIERLEQAEPGTKAAVKIEVAGPQSGAAPVESETVPVERAEAVGDPPEVPEPQAAEAEPVAEPVPSEAEELMMPPEPAGAPADEPMPPPPADEPQPEAEVRRRHWWRFGRE